MIEDRIRGTIERRVKEGEEVDTAAMVRLFQLQKRIAQKAGLLLTERQYADYEAQRHFRIGDRVKYIGETRTEDTPQGPYTRPYGQLGLITVAGAIVHFEPDDMSCKLICRQDSHLLERIEDNNHE